MKYLVSLSGGKDSTACLLWALDTLPRDDIIPYYNDTLWEHEAVYEYLVYLEKRLDIKIIRNVTEGMVELSKRKKYMPSPTRRFCTYELKIKPFLIFVYDNFISKGVDFINITGIRREESPLRADTECFKIQRETIRFDDGRDNITVDIKVMHPLVYWDTQRVFDYHKKHGIGVNPLYKKGFYRVGCYPCIYARKHDIQMLEPKYKQRLRNLEKEISKINGTPAKWFNPERDKFLRPTLDFGEEYNNKCVNQYGICE